MMKELESVLHFLLKHASCTQHRSGTEGQVDMISMEVLAEWGLAHTAAWVL